MDEGVASEVRFFHLSSRIGRLRYFAYSVVMSYASMPFYVTGTVLMLRHSYLTGLSLVLVADIFFIPIQITFLIRRLHDLDRSGWWCLFYAVLVPFGLVSVLHRLSGPMRALHLLLILVNLGFVLMLLFSAGTAGDNRYGPPPPPNSPWVIAGAWSALALPLLMFVLVFAAGLRFSDVLQRAQATRAVELARRAEEQARIYHQDNKNWPTDLGGLYGGALTHNPGDHISTIKYPDGSYGIVATLGGYGTQAVEVWTYDGETWHCGPANASTLSKDYLPDNCQEDSPPTH